MTMNRIVDAKEHYHPSNPVGGSAGKAGAEYRLARLRALRNPILRREVNIHERY